MLVKELNFDGLLRKWCFPEGHWDDVAPKSGAKTP
jgi:hypothetical protein